MIIKKNKLNVLSEAIVLVQGAHADHTETQRERWLILKLEVMSSYWKVALKLLDTSIYA